MLDRSEPCRGRFSIFEKSSIFSFGRQKAHLLTFCAKISSNRRVWFNCYWNRVEWTQEMLFNTYHHTRTCLDEKIEIVEKNFKIIFSLPISLRVTLKRSLRSWFSAKNTTFLNFFSETMKSCGYMFIGLVYVLWMPWHLLELNIPSFDPYSNHVYLPELFGHGKNLIFWAFC